MAGTVQNNRPCELDRNRAGLCRACSVQFWRKPKSTEHACKAHSRIIGKVNRVNVMNMLAINMLYVPWDLSILPFFRRFIMIRIGVAVVIGVAVIKIVAAIPALLKAVKSYIYSK